MSGLCDRVKAYVTNVRLALDSLSEVPKEFEKVIEICKAYVSDAEYYLSKGDCETALACIAYAEGLIDSLRHAGIVDIKWRPLTEVLKRPTVLVAGSFEILHPGHIELLKKAYELGNVVVVVSRDENFRKFKGRDPVVPAEQRAYVISHVKYVSRAMVGFSNPFDAIRAIKPDIILLGPDQPIGEEDVKRFLEREGIKAKVVKLRNLFRHNKFLTKTSEILKRVIEVMAVEPKKYC